MVCVGDEVRCTAPYAVGWSPGRVNAIHGGVATVTFAASTLSIPLVYLIPVGGITS